MASVLMLTEERAQARRCPALNGPCIASKCMWWRWDEEYNDELREGIRERWEPGTPGDVWFDHAANMVGYCGAAGRPKTREI